MNIHLRKQLSLLILIITSILDTFAYDFKIDGIYYNRISATDFEVTTDKNGRYSGNVIIPEKVIYNDKEFNVTQIGDYAFNLCVGLQSVKLPEGITSIGEFAFNGCKALEHFEIPQNVTTIKN